MKKVLLIQYKMLGDVLTSSVIASELKQYYGRKQVEIHYVIQKLGDALVQNHPDIDNLITVRNEDFELSSGLFAFAKAIRKSNYDIVIDAYGKIGSAILTKASGAKVTIGFKKSYLSFLYRHSVSQKAPSNFIIGEALGSRLNLLTPLFQPTNAFLPRIYVDEDEKKVAKTKIMESGVELNKPIVMISILGSGKNKSMPAPYMAEILDHLADKGLEMLLNFAPQQQDDASAIVSLCKPATLVRVHQDLYEPDLRKSLAIMSMTDAVIGNEGGAINMAKALEIPTFTLFSPWIRKEVWNISESDQHVAVHLIDYHPEQYEGRIPRDVKDQTHELYQLLRPRLFKDRLNDFINLIADDR